MLPVTQAKIWDNNFQGLTSFANLKLVFDNICYNLNYCFPVDILPVSVFS